MQAYLDYNENECPWYYFDGSYKILLGACLIVFGIFGVLLNGWLFVTFIHSHLIIFKSHILVLNLCTASFGRNLLGFPFSGSSAIAKKWLFGTACCQFFAFLNQFFGILQMTALSVQVLERYILAKYYRRERRPSLKLYWILIIVCWGNAILFAIPPLFGTGIYSCDTTGTLCTLSWPSFLSSAKHLGFNVPYVIVCGAIPVVAIFYFAGKAVRLERIYYRGEELREHKRLTRSVHASSIITLALWIPAAIEAGWQWIPLLLYGYKPHVPPVLALLAPIASEAATSVPVLCYLVGDERLRAALLGRVQKNYALLHPLVAKRYNQE